MEHKGVFSFDPVPYPQFRSCAKGLCEQRIRTLKARAFPPWYARLGHDVRERPADAVALCAFAGLAIAVSIWRIRERAGDRALPLICVFLTVCGFVILLCGVADGRWRRAHPDGGYLDSCVRERALQEAGDFYRAQQELLDHLIAAYGADQVARLKCLLPATDAELQMRRTFWSVERQTFRREYDAAFAYWQAIQNKTAAS